ncbi:MAG: HDOD domain-containing protein [Nitrospirae bacterium]|nr:HDOD domain-containing protein [Nitrospirota bacterium]
MIQEDKGSAKDQILAKLHRRSDFPAMSSTIKIINEFKKSDDTPVSEFANIVLKDYALTEKILKLVNSVNYAQFGEVTTISRATILLGMENIKNLALTLMLFDYFQKNNTNVEHIDTMVKSLYSGILAQNIASEISFVAEEEAFICSLFHSFGKMLVSFALPEKIEEIKFIKSERDVTEDAAALSVLGGRYEDIGMAMAKDFNFPNKIIYSMHKLRGMGIQGKVATSDTDKLYKLNCISSFANELSNILSTCVGRKEMDEKIRDLTAAFRDHFGMLDGKIESIITASLDTLNEFSSVFKVNLDVIPFKRQMQAWVGKTEKPAAASGETVLTDISSEVLETIDIICESDKQDTPDSIFAKGIQDINSSILSNFALNDVVSIALETMYRGMQLSREARALFLIKDVKLPVMNIRYGFGSEIQELKKWFKIALGADDIFNFVMMKQSDLVIKDIESPDISKLLPDWFKNKVFAESFVVLLPIIIEKKPVGLFYVEGDKKGLQKISASQLNYLRILRDQTVVAIRQKRSS